MGYNIDGVLNNLKLKKAVDDIKSLLDDEVEFGKKIEGLKTGLEKKLEINRKIEFILRIIDSEIDDVDKLDVIKKITLMELDTIPHDYDIHADAEWVELDRIVSHFIYLEDKRIIKAVAEAIKKLNSSCEKRDIMQPDVVIIVTPWRVVEVFPEDLLEVLPL